MPEMVPPSPTDSAPNVLSFLLLVAVLILLASTIYLALLGCTAFGVGTFFKAIYSTQRIPQIAALALAFV